MEKMPRSELEKLSAMHETLLSDLTEGFKQHDNLDGSTRDRCKRQIIHSLFALIEAELFIVKQFIMRYYENVTIGEQVMLSEARFELDDKGEVRETDYYPRLKYNIRFTLTLLERMRKGKWQWNSEEWGCKELLSLIVVRNRLTHPKSLTDLDVSNVSVKDIAMAIEWFSLRTFPMVGGGGPLAWE